MQDLGHVAMQLVDTLQAARTLLSAEPCFSCLYTLHASEEERDSQLHSCRKKASYPDSHAAHCT